jgi:hypothetical protein
MMHALRYVIWYAWQPADLVPLAYVTYQWLKRGTADL